MHVFIAFFAEVYMADSTADLSAQDVQNIAVLARLAISSHEAEGYASSLNRILGLMDRLKTFDTDGIVPMASPHDSAQPLRDDRPTEPNRRDAYQAVAPATQDGLYLVPRVIE
jgi:aspartyl-tRNA(Asn)/glutamyl-tRNA(Gln) amidotransferase subunit C